MLDYGIKRISRLKKTASLYLYKMFLEYRGRMPYTTINLTGYSIVTAMIKSEEKEHLTTVHIKLTSKRNKNQKDRTRLTWYVKREELQEAINAIVDGSLILESMISEGFWSEWRGSNSRPRGPKPRVLSAELHPDIQFLSLYHGGEENQRFFCLWSFMWSKPLLCRFLQPGEIQQTQASQGFATFRLTPSRIPPRHSQTRRDTNFAIPGYNALL